MSRASARLPAPACDADAKLKAIAPLRRILRLAIGIGLVILGIIGLILPVMPGWIFLIPGLIILSDFFPPLKRVLEWAKRKALEAKDSRWPR
jgi:uncharacterized membrane protein YbaN (DUF454 family)